MAYVAGTRPPPFQDHLRDDSLTEDVPEGNVGPTVRVHPPTSPPFASQLARTPPQSFKDIGADDSAMDVSNDDVETGAPQRNLVPQTPPLLLQESPRPTPHRRVPAASRCNPSRVVSHETPVASGSAESRPVVPPLLIRGDLAINQRCSSLLLLIFPGLSQVLGSRPRELCPVCAIISFFAFSLAVLTSVVNIFR